MNIGVRGGGARGGGGLQPVSHAYEIKRAAAVVKTLYENGLHTVLPVFYKASSILATISATSCSAERSFSGLRRVKTYLRSTMGQERLSSIFFFAWNEHILTELLKISPSVSSV